MTLIGKAAAIVALAALTACVSTPPREATRDATWVLTDRAAMGGDISKHYRHLEKLWAAGTAVRIEADTVTSAGTFYLAAKPVCMANRDTVFRFHGPQNAALAVLASAVTVIPPPVSFQSKAKAGNTRLLMAELYEHAAPGLGDWFTEHAAWKAGVMTTNLTAQQMHERFGFEWCEAQ